MLSEALREFVSVADSHIIGGRAVGSPIEIIHGALGREFRGLRVTASFGQGRAARVPWIVLLGHGQSTSKGIYPAFLYFKERRTLILAYGISTSHPPTTQWTAVENKQSIKEFFAKRGWGAPPEYGNSIVHESYEVDGNFNEAAIMNALNEVIDEFHAVFSSPGEGEKLNVDDVADLREVKEVHLGSVIENLLETDTELRQIHNDEEFHFKKARQVFSEFESKTFTREFLTRVLSRYDSANGGFAERLNSIDPDSNDYTFLDLIGRLVSYCDISAANKNTYNEYEDKRTLARSFVRQHVWVKNLIKYKLNDFDPQPIPAIIQNALSYLKDPSTQLTMLADPHRAKVSQKLLGLDDYYKELFVSQLLEFFEPFEISPANPENLTHLISRILYSPAIKRLWHDEPAIVELADETEVEQEGAADVSIEEYTRSDALKELFFSESLLDGIMSRLTRKKNIILQGPPGVGKTYLAKRIAFLKMGEKDTSRVEMVQFHQSYSYEDFVQGYRLNEDGKFVIREGLFYQFCLRAKKDPDRDYFFIIDEINRGNLSKIFGELMMLLEHDKRGPEHQLPLTYSKSANDRFYVPKNLYLIGTMNTADRSLSMVDYALRRRFSFVELAPGFDDPKFADFLSSAGAETELINKIVNRITALNAEISSDGRNLGKGFCIGHSYFCPTNGSEPDGSWYEEIVHSEIKPLLEEYWLDNESKVNEVLESLLG